jgi:PAS domain S-box-containing protein
MPAFPLTADLSRLHTLRSLAELDTSSDATLNDLVQVAAHALRCPMAAVCLSDADRHWVKASYGVEVDAHAADGRFHAAAIQGGELLVVEDTHLDARFAGSPEVQAQGLRFYVGAPIRIDGHTVGTLCLGAWEPRALEDGERVVVMDLAHAVEHWFLGRREQVRLQAREREFRELAEQMPGIVYRAALDANRSTLYVSSQIRELGYSTQEWMANPDAWLHALHPADRERTLIELSQGLAQRHPFELTYRLRTRNGAWRHFRDVVRVVMPTDGEGPVIQGVMLDVTERAMAQAEREMLLHDLPDGVLLLDARQRITDANPQAQALLGKPLDALRGRHIGHLFAMDQYPLQGEQELLALADEPDTTERDYWHPDGGLRTLEERRRVVDGGAEVRVLRDVTHRREETGWLRMLAQAAEQAAESIVITDLAANIVYVNQAMCKTSGYARADLMGRNSRLLQSGLTPASRYGKLWAQLTAGKTWRGFFNNRRKDGSHYLEFAVITPVRGPSGRITHYLAVKEDISEKRRMREDLRRYQQQLDDLVVQRTEELEAAKRLAERASAAKSAFLATMSHEIRTPMNGVIGIADVLRASGLSPQQMDLVDTIHESAHVLLDLIDDILDFSKIEAGRLELVCEPFDLGRLVEHACDAVLPLAREKAVYLHGFVDPALSDQWLGDAARVRQILLNLVGNAIKFSAGLGRRGEVSVVARPGPGGGLQLVVRDNGIGMNEDVQQRIFRPFVQGEESTARSYGGTGLGLVICQRLVGAMGGSIGLTSAPDLGSSFVVDLPLAVAPAVKPPPAIHLEGLHCQLDVGLHASAGHWRRYLEAAGATTSMAGDGLFMPQDGVASVCIVETVPADSGAPDTGRDDPRPGLVLLRDAARGEPALDANGHVVLHTQGMHRSDLIQAVGMAARRISPASRAPAPPTLLSDDLRAAAGGRPVLVAEDNEINQKVISRQLGMLGLDCEVVNDGRAALERWRQAPGRYAMLLTDLRMPGMDGLSLTRAIRESGGLGERLPVLALTANVLGSENGRSRDAGLNGYLNKPVDLEQLKAALAACLRPAGTDQPSRGTPEPVAGANTGPVPEFDDQLPARLLGDDPESLAELRQQFVRASQRAMEEIRNAVGQDDWSQVGFVAHRIKSSAHATGAVRLRRLLDELERATREQRIDDARRCLQEVEPAVVAVHEHFCALSGIARVGEHMLVCVDDDQDHLDRLQQVALQHGVPRPQVFGSGSAFLDSLPAADTAGVLVMLDLLMPQMDGVELIRHLSNRGFVGGVVICSEADPAVVEAAAHLLKAQGVRYLGQVGKPVAGEQLAGLWQSWCDRNPAT